jgi:FdhD protein
MASPQTNKTNMSDGSGSVSVSVVVEGSGNKSDHQDWQLAEEVPVNLAYNGRPHVVMMATPADLEDFARGFSLSEGVLSGVDLIEKVNVEPVTGGIMINVETAPRTKIAKERQARSQEGRSGCGICGLQSLDQVVRNVSPVKGTFQLSAKAAAKAFAMLPESQPMNRLNHSVHAAAWCTPDGAITLIREDVGRHNALDKLIGAIAINDQIDPASGFVVMTSRCSFELVQKSAAIGIPALVTVSAPTSLALDLAGKAGMVLATQSKTGIVMFKPDQDQQDTP